MKDEIYLLKNTDVKRERINIFDYMVIVFAIIASATPLNSLYHTQTCLLFFGFALMFFLKQKIKYGLVIQKTKVVFCIVILFLIFMTAIVNLDSDMNYYFGLATIVGGSYLVVDSMEYSKFKFIYIRLFLIITIYSILLTVLVFVLPSFLNILTDVYLPESKIPSWKTFCYIYFVWDLFARNGMLRNSACFREPGVWGSFISIAIIMKISQMIKDKENLIRKDYVELIVLFIGAISSLSTSTIICMCFAYGLYFFNSKHTQKKFLSLIFVVVLFAIAIVIWGDILFAKFDVSSTSHFSLTDRIVGIPDSLELWKQHPIFGSGYTKYFENVVEGANTFSYMFVLGEFGIILLFLFLFMLWGWIGLESINGISRMFVFLELSIILNSQNLIFFPLIMLLMFYGAKRTIKIRSISFFR